MACSAKYDAKTAEEFAAITLTLAAQYRKEKSVRASAAR